MFLEISRDSNDTFSNISSDSFGVIWVSTTGIVGLDVKREDERFCLFLSDDSASCLKLSLFAGVFCFHLFGGLLDLGSLLVSGGLVGADFSSDVTLRNSTMLQNAILLSYSFIRWTCVNIVR